MTRATRTEIAPVPDEPNFNPATDKPSAPEAMEAHRPDPAAPHPETPTSPLVEAAEREPSRLKRLLLVTGPGLTSGASNTDPSAIAVYAGAGAAFGLATLWAIPLLLPMMVLVVYLCAKLGMVGGKGLAGLIADRYPRAVLYPVVIALFCANTFNAGADLGGITSGIALLVPIPRPIILPIITFGILAAQVWGSYDLIVGILKWLTLALLAFVIAGVVARPDWLAVFRSTVVPTVRFDNGYLFTLVAFVGTMLSPYLYFWQAGQRVEEEVSHGRRRLWQRKGATRGELTYAGWDVIGGMVVAALIIYFIIVCTASTLHRAGQTHVATAEDAARALEPLAGRAAEALFAVGFVGAGLLAVPVLTTGAAYALAETFGWTYGLHRRPRAAPRFYIVIAASTLIGMGLNYTGLTPMQALVIAATANGLLAPIVLVLVMLASSSRTLMGTHRNRPIVNLAGWATTALVTVAAVSAVLSLARK